jgi:hypothetical protein
LSGIREDARAVVFPNEAARTEFLRLLDLLAASPANLAQSVTLWQRWSAAREGGYAGRIDGVWGWKSEQAFINDVPYAWLRSTKLTDLAKVQELAAGSDLDIGDLYAVGLARDQWRTPNVGVYPSKIPAPPAIDEPEPTRVEITFPEQPDGGVTITPVDERDPDAAIPRYVQITLPDGGTVGPGDTVVITPVEEDLTGGKKRNWIGWGLLALGGTIVVGSVILAGRQSKKAEG